MMKTNKTQIQHDIENFITLTLHLYDEQEAEVKQGSREKQAVPVSYKALAMSIKLTLFSRLS